MDQRTRLLSCGMAAGPLYILVGAVQIAFRPGFDPTRHALSLLSNGDLGWIQIANFLVTGALLVVGAIGAAQALTAGRGYKWAPRMVGLYGMGLIGAGFFRADPGLGFPPGTPLTHNPITWHGQMHFAAGGVGFTGLIASCLIFAARFDESGEKTWAASSLATGIFFLDVLYGNRIGS